MACTVDGREASAQQSWADRSTSRGGRGISIRDEQARPPTRRIGEGSHRQRFSGNQRPTTPAGRGSGTQCERLIHAMRVGRTKAPHATSVKIAAKPSAVDVRPDRRGSELLPRAAVATAGENARRRQGRNDQQELQHACTPRNDKRTSVWARLFNELQTATLSSHRKASSDGGVKIRKMDNLDGTPVPP
jgi:hypothetical protein